jgi:hypothetical protein
MTAQFHLKSRVSALSDLKRIILNIFVAFFHPSVQWQCKLYSESNSIPMYIPRTINLSGETNPWLNVCRGAVDEDATPPGDTLILSWNYVSVVGQLHLPTSFRLSSVQMKLKVLFNITIYTLAGFDLTTRLLGGRRRRCHTYHQTTPQGQ